MSEDKDEGMPDKIDSEDGRQIVAGGKAMVIDIRDPDDFAEERIFNAERLDADDVTERMDYVLDDEGDDREAFLIICSDGSESSELAEKLREDGYAASSLKGGFKAWTGDHLPTAPGRDEEYEGPKLAVPGAVASETQPDDDEEEEGEEDDEEADDGDGDEGDESERGEGRGADVGEADAGDADDEDAAGNEADAEGGRAQAPPEDITDEEKAERAEDA